MDCFFFGSSQSLDGNKNEHKKVNFFPHPKTSARIKSQEMEEDDENAQPICDN